MEQNIRDSRSLSRTFPRLAMFALSIIAVFSGGSTGVAGEKRKAAQPLHWAFQQVTRSVVPTVADASQARTPIDRFILRKLQERGLRFRPMSNRRAFLRRVKFDLLGLPPTLAEMERFLTDHRPGAHERLIERLLASPHYGEAWGRNWLDLVRFAETGGFNADPHRPLAYKYRDYVIRSFNANKPYRQFVAEQLAGDELFPHRAEALIATGYNRMWPDESNASDVLLARQDALNDLTKNVGSVFLGVSIGCAQCHDHKFDPIPQVDFYRLQAFFAGIVPRESVALGTHRQLTEYRKQLDRWLAKTKDVRSELHRLETAARAKSGRIKRLKFPAVVLKAIDSPPEKRTAYQWQLVLWSERQIVVSEKQLLAQLSKPQQKRREELKRKFAVSRKQKPRPPRTIAAMATVEIPSGPAKTHLLDGGSYNKPLAELQPGFLTVTLNGRKPAAAIRSPRPGTSGRRATLVRWMFDRRNPLTARVMVNRIWQGHFGRGLVSNANDFGTRTPAPSHPQLLDWLAAEFVASGWNIKHMNRLILSSAVYRQSAYRRTAGAPVPLAAQRDPGNRLYWSFPRRRLSAERIRDSLLAVAGQLNRAMYGPGIKPKLPPNFSARHAWKPSKSLAARNRRSVYIYAKRNLPFPLLKAFDLPDMHESCARRAETTIAPQALLLLNSELVLNAARSFASRLVQESSVSGREMQIRHAYLLAFARPPAADELRAAVEFLREQQKLLQHANGAGMTSPGHQALVDFCHALLNANEFLYVE
ncbi:MAG: DUF1553 domain-containing protein [Planctomycetes bacterium]|nr:DUF1553 domain-containing protein [Planctomycetota bacterium]